MAAWDTAKGIIKTDNDLVCRMNKIRDEHAAVQALLADKRSQIAELSKIAIYVYRNREIAPLEEMTTVQFDDTGHEDLYALLREQVEAEDFRPKDLRVVARLIRIVANLSCGYEIVFDDPEVEHAYEIFSSNH